jgi:hypothetical protein
MTLQDEKQIATGFYHGLQLVAGYMKDRVHPKQEELINAGDRENCLRGLFLRALGMTNTLARLNDPLDFQSIMAITRGLLELTVDFFRMTAKIISLAVWSRVNELGNKGFVSQFASCLLNF